MNSHMNKNLRNWLVLVVLVVVAVFAAIWATSTPWFQPRERPPVENLADIELFYTMETIVSVINVTLSTFLLLMYASIYRKTRSEFTIGLILFSAVLLFHAFLAIPLVQRAFGFFQLGLGPFAVLPDIFTCAALAVLLYLTYRY